MIPHPGKCCKAGERDAITVLVTECKTVLMLLIFIQKSTINNNGTSLGADLVRPIVGRSVGRHIVGVVEYRLCVYAARLFTFKIRSEILTHIHIFTYSLSSERPLSSQH